MSQTTHFSLAVGALVGRYEVLRGLARGGMGEVYLARVSGESASRVVALKVLRPELQADEDICSMFREEAAVLLRLDHASVARAFELVHDGARDVLVMEYIRGHSAAALLTAWREEPPESHVLGAQLVARVARATDYVHSAKDHAGKTVGLVHRDLSPDNVMLCPDGGIKLLDFGIARKTMQTSVTSAGVLKGKVNYMSPEQLRQDPLDRRSDIFQLGTLLYELTTRTHPFAGNNFAATMNAILSGDVIDPRERLASLEPALSDIILRALEFEPEDRFNTAAEFADALEDFLDHCGQRVRSNDLTAEFVRVFGEPPPLPPQLSTARTPRAILSRRPRLWGTVLPLPCATLAATFGALQWLDVGAAATEREAMDALELALLLCATAIGLAVIPLAVALVQRRRRAAALAIGLTLSGSGCGAPPRPCEDRRPCNLAEGGYCDATQRRCIYPAPDCDSGFRFGPFAGSASGCTQPWDPASTAFALPTHADAAVDGDPAEMTLGRPLVIDSDFGVHAEVWFRTSERGLYVAAVVDDPQLEATQPPYQPLWEDDGVEILFDTGWDRATGPMPGTDDYKFVVTAINATSVSWGGVTPRTAWSLPIESAVRMRGTINQPADVDEGYDVELFVPWGDGFRRPSPGTAWGVNLQINDRYGGAGRDAAWRTQTPLNHPAGAGVLVFSPPPSTPQRPARDATATPPPFTVLPLAETVRSVSVELRERQPIEHAFDDCLAPRSACTVATDHASSVTVNFDLGTTHELAAARLFGDTRHEWVSRTWTVRLRDDEGAPWVSVVDAANASFDGWHFMRADNVRARFVELTVVGDPGYGVEFREFQLLGRK
ncbi:MAG: protein kinase domain-containing protein [Nannocystales bacterium]